MATSKGSDRVTGPLLADSDEIAESAQVNLSRRNALRSAIMVGGGLALAGTAATDATAQNGASKTCTPKGEWQSLFDGKTLNGWHSTPRVYGPLYPGGPMMERTPEYIRDSKLYQAQWLVEDGAIVGRQDPEHPGYGGFLLTDRHFADFELKIEVNNDWPTDSGISMRKADRDWAGIQVLIDHRPAGGIGGYFGNSLAHFHAMKFAIDMKPDGTGLRTVPQSESVDPWKVDRSALLQYFISEEGFLKAWKWKGWNEFTIRSVGKIPQITTHINDTLISMIDLAKIEWENYDPDEMFRLLGWSGSIALEVHDNVGAGGLSDARWGRGAKCRWRNIRIREL